MAASTALKDGCMMRGVSALRSVASIASVALAALSQAGAQTPAEPVARAAAAAPACEVTIERARLDAPLARTARKLADGLPITIVALGSSSTSGFGASSPAASYPSRLAEDLARRLPGRPITVLNRGLVNDEAAQTLARLDRDVIAARPDLILWQIGTNALLRNAPLQIEVLRHGLSRMKATGADVVLIDLQFAPRVIPRRKAEPMLSFIAQVASTEHVNVFRRYELMRHWHEIDRLPLDTFLWSDGLHMNDWSYACLGKWIGAAITDAATRPAVAAAR